MESMHSSALKALLMINTLHMRAHIMLLLHVLRASLDQGKNARSMYIGTIRNVAVLNASSGGSRRGVAA
jgi:hypothetical protein